MNHRSRNCPFRKMGAAAPPALPILKKPTWTHLIWFIFLVVTILFVLHISFNPFLLPPSPLITDDLKKPQPIMPEMLMISSLRSPESSSAKCDLSVGEWVRDERASYYTNISCMTIPESKNCGKYGKDMDIVNWRWKPQGCELARFDPGVFLRSLRGKTMGFVGDSVVRNHFESLLCILSQVETPTETFKDPEASEDKGFRTWFFPSENFTMMVLWTRFLVEAEERTVDGSLLTDLHIDKLDRNWTDHLPNIDITVISTGHWFFRKIYIYDGERMTGCIFCSEPNITHLSVSSTIQTVLRRAFDHINSREDCDGMVTILRTFSPSHFEGGMWNTGGYCNRTSPMSKAELEEDTNRKTAWVVSRGQVEEIERAKRYNGGKKKGKAIFETLDVTKAMVARGDSHPGSHLNFQWKKGISDCIHWCLPGPIDIWNDLLLSQLKIQIPISNLLS